ncbi:hypothetical protein BDB00DRAFT_860194 [Zychaea mexicana]|uniref:uncharacterized protein n=1 Tax=Zychaea mexicana TaxID=64656 RepID=UPI0022FE84B3|nr:uncharacterized protein BDB00DRAFT_860194 [Zychaea mexicana]KAI9474843.1 hypothetical protein BDB00DRAFT_860194 [Zychaea mexicana]
MFGQSTTSQSVGTFSLRGSDNTTVSSSPFANNSNNNNNNASTMSTPAVAKPLFSQVDTSINNRPFAVRSSNNGSSNNNSLLFTSTSNTTNATHNLTAPTTAGIPASIPLQSTLHNKETSFNLDLTNTTTATTRSAAFRGYWQSPPTFFISSQEQQDNDMDVDQLTSETTTNVAFGEGKSLLRFRPNPESSRIAGRKREIAASLSSERRVSFKRTSTDEGKGKARADDGSKADTTVSDREEAESIYVFGFAPGTEQQIIDYFASHGKIVQHNTSTGNWITIRYDSAASAEKGLKSNGVAVTGDHIIGVTRGTNKKTQTATAEASTASSHKDDVFRVIPFDQAKNLYKKPEAMKGAQQPSSAAEGLGSGKTGLSVLNVPTVNPPGDVKLIKDTGLLTKVKDFLFEW